MAYDTIFVILDSSNVELGWAGTVSGRENAINWNVISKIESTIWFLGVL